jgi:hypothetical protein
VIIGGEDEREPQSTCLSRILKKKPLMHRCQDLDSGSLLCATIAWILCSTDDVSVSLVFRICVLHNWHGIISLVPDEELQ